MSAIMHNGRAFRRGGVAAVLLGVALLGAPALAESGQGGEGKTGDASSSDSDTAALEAVLSPEGEASEGESSEDGSEKEASTGSGDGAAGDANPGAEGEAGSDAEAAGAGKKGEAGNSSSNAAIDEYLKRLQSANEAGAFEEPRQDASGKASGDSGGGAGGEVGGASAVSRAAGGLSRTESEKGGGSTSQTASGDGSPASGAGSPDPEPSARRSAPEPPELETLEPEEAEALTAGEARQRSVRILVRAAVGGEAALRSNAIEALSLMPGRALPLTNKALSDPNPGVRFAAAVTAARLGFESLVPTLRPLLKDENASVQAAALSALHKLGEDVNLTPLAGMLRSQNPQLRANVALLLGLLGDESAVPMLQKAASAPLRRASAARAAVVRVQVAEAIARLNSDTALDALRAGMYSQFGEVRVVAVTAMGAIGDERMGPAVANLLRDRLPVELQLAAAAALARLDDAQGLERVLERSDHDRPAVRAQVAWSLGWFEGDAGVTTLKRLLADPSRQVRVSAAASVLRRLGRGSGG